MPDSVHSMAVIARIISISSLLMSFNGIDEDGNDTGPSSFVSGGQRAQRPAHHARKRPASGGGRSGSGRTWVFRPMRTAGPHGLERLTRTAVRRCPRQGLSRNASVADAGHSLTGSEGLPGLPRNPAGQHHPDASTGQGLRPVACAKQAGQSATNARRLPAAGRASTGNRRRGSVFRFARWRDAFEPLSLENFSGSGFPVRSGFTGRRFAVQPLAHLPDFAGRKDARRPGKKLHDRLLSAKIGAFA